MTVTTESSTPDTTTDPNPRAELIGGLRALADFYETHPEFPLPFNLPGASGIGGLFMCAEWDDADRFSELASQLGGNRTKTVTNDWFEITRDFGPLRLELSTHRETVCEKVETGRTRTVTVETLPAEVEAQITRLRAEHAVTETIEEPEIEWRCSPVLDRDRGLEGVADLRDAAREARATA